MIEIEILAVRLLLSRSSNYQHRILIPIETSFDASSIPRRIDLWIVTGRWWCLNISYTLCLFRLAFDSNCNRYSIINIVGIVSFFFLLLFFLRTIGFWILLVWNVAKNLSNELIFQKEVKCIESKFDRTIIK